jgi:hypothetical protein
MSSDLRVQQAELAAMKLLESRERSFLRDGRPAALAEPGNPIPVGRAVRHSGPPAGGGGAVRRTSGAVGPICLRPESISCGRYAIVGRCREAGLLVSTEDDNLLTMFPPLTINREIARQGLDLLEGCL